jgi:hypothetical protein
VEAEASEKITSQPTLATGLLAGGTALIQVTSRDVKVWSNIVAGTSAGTWEVGQEQEIIAAQVQGELAVVAKRGGELVVLVASESSLKPVV